MNRKLFIGKIHEQKRNIVGDSVRELAYDIPERNFSAFEVIIVSRSDDKLTTNRKIFCKLGPSGKMTEPATTAGPASTPH